MNKNYIVDIETNSLNNPTKIHCIVFRNVDTSETFIFENVKKNQSDLKKFLEERVLRLIGHNIVSFDYPVLRSWFDDVMDDFNVVDTLIISRLLNYNIKGGHSLEAWGNRLKIPKVGVDIKDWSVYTPLMKERCIQDTLINLRLYEFQQKYLKDSRWDAAVKLEHELQFLCNNLTENGFPFDKQKAEELKEYLETLIKPIDEGLHKAFPPRVVEEKTITPRVTKSGALNKNDFRWLKSDDLTAFNGGPFSVFHYEPFNPASPKQIVERLNEAGWKPTEKTKGHIEAERDKSPDGKRRLESFRRVGWKVSEQNLKTLPDTAPEATRKLAQRILLASRISDLEEWLELCEEISDGLQAEDNRNGIKRFDFRNLQQNKNSFGKRDSDVSRKIIEEDRRDGERERTVSISLPKLFRIRGQFGGIGSWTQRMNHRKPNMANIPVAKRSNKDNEFETLSNDINDRMRSLWVARSGHRLVGVDADGIQMRVFAHYCNDEKLIKALIEGSKEDESDIHSVNRRGLGGLCKSRDAAKTFIYAWLLGAGFGKVSEILECSYQGAKEAVSSFIKFYPGLGELKQTKIVSDAERGYFEGLDGRLVAVPSAHKVLAGYLQNGEKIIMARAAVQWNQELNKLNIPFVFRNFVHDEWQTEVPDDDEIANKVAEVQCNSIVRQAEELSLNCPLRANAVFGYTWKDTH